MNFDVLHAQKKGAIELTDAELQSVYGGQGGSDTNVPLDIPINLEQPNILGILVPIISPPSNAQTSTSPAGSSHSRRQTSISSDEGD